MNGFRGKVTNLSELTSRSGQEYLGNCKNGVKTLTGTEAVPGNVGFTIS